MRSESHYSSFAEYYGVGSWCCYYIKIGKAPGRTCTYILGAKIAGSLIVELLVWGYSLRPSDGLLRGGYLIWSSVSCLNCDQVLYLGDAFAGSADLAGTWAVGCGTVAARFSFRRFKSYLRIFIATSSPSH